MKKIRLILPLIFLMVLLSGCSTSLVTVNIDSNVSTIETKTTNGIDALNL